MFWVVIMLLVMLVSVLIYHQVKPLPEGTSYESKLHYTTEVDFLVDLTYDTFDGETIHEQEIFAATLKMIEEAEVFIIVDMFLFNNRTGTARHYPHISGMLTAKLISQKAKYPDLQIVFISDPINNGYHSYEAEQFKALQASGIEVVLTSLSELRDSNPGYSAVWRTLFQVFGQRGIGWVPNVISSDSPNVTLRSYLKLINVKANHRKAFVTEKAAIITSANAHDASGFYSNIALKVSGSIIADIVETEQAVINYSGGKTVINVPKMTTEQGDIALQYVTEGKILKAILEEMKQTEQNDELWLGMFYLADRKVVTALSAAAKRGVTVNIILDPNKAAFGRQKIGLPNLPIADELNQHDAVTIRWYNAGKEQYHTKLLYIRKVDESIIIGGSANYTRRNLADLNLENNMIVRASSDKQIMVDVDNYFKRLWTNADGLFTLDYHEQHEMLLPLLKLTYWLQRITGFTTY